MNKEFMYSALFGGLFIAVMVGYGVLFFLVPIPNLFKIIIGIVVILLSYTMFKVILQRRDEIREEEKDDLSKY